MAITMAARWCFYKVVSLVSTCHELLPLAACRLTCNTDVKGICMQVGIQSCCQLMQAIRSTHKHTHTRAHKHSSGRKHKQNTKWRIKVDKYLCV